MWKCGNVEMWKCENVKIAHTSQPKTIVLLFDRVGVFSKINFHISTFSNS